MTLRSLSSRLPILAVDARMVGPVPHGFARYVSGLAEGLRKLRDQPGGLAYEPVFLVGEDLEGGAFYGFKTYGVRAGFLSPSELWELPAALNKIGAALYHSPSFSSLLYSPCPWISTPHDLNHLEFGTLRDRVYYRWILKPFFARALARATVSEFSRNELHRWSGIPAAEIDVVLNPLDRSQIDPVDEAFVQEVLERHQLEAGKYFFCLSNPKRHKNVAIAIEAYSRLASPAWKFVLNFTPDQTCDGVHVVEYPSDEEVRAIRQGAGAVVFPSLYEGFGLPPVEAAVQGVPLIVSSIPAHQEALSDLRPEEAIWVDPNDLEGWSRAMARAMAGRIPPASPETRDRIRNRLTPWNTAKGWDEIYQRVLREMERR